MINEQELADAIDRLREGERVMSVTADDVLIAMMNDLVFRNAIMAKLYYLEGSQEYFEDKFNEAADDLLLQAKENELTHQAELNEIEAFAERNHVTHKRACVMLGKDVNRYDELKGE